MNLFVCRMYNAENRSHKKLMDADKDLKTENQTNRSNVRDNENREGKIHENENAKSTDNLQQGNLQNENETNQNAQNMNNTTPNDIADTDFPSDPNKMEYSDEKHSDDEEESNSYEQENQTIADQDIANDVLRIKQLSPPVKQIFEYSDSEETPKATDANIKALVNSIVEILMWKRPFIMIINIIFTEIFFLCIYFLDLDALSTLVALLIAIHSGLLIYTLLPRAVKNWFFPPIDESQENSIVTWFFKEASDKYKRAVEWGRNYILHPNAIDTLLFIGTSLLLFTIFLVIGSFWAFVIACHALYFYPALKYSSNVRTFVGDRFEAINNVVNPKEIME